jgi:putative membrane protein
MYWGNHMGTGDWIFSILGTVIVLALLIGGIAWLVSTLGERERQVPRARESTREILDRRLASGEVTIEQYERLRETLQTTGEPTSSKPSPPRPAGVQG